MGSLLSVCLFQPPHEPTPLPNSKFFFLRTISKQSYIPVVFIKFRDGNCKTILYSHGNAEDLGLVYNYLEDLSNLFKVNICSYDYTGYGLSNMKKGEAVQTRRRLPSEKQCYDDIETVYQYLTLSRGIHPKDIILYGRSLGSGPSCYIASKTWIDEDKNMGEGVGGLILHSAFSSVFRIGLNLGYTCSGDMFPNIDLVENIGCPVLNIHGSEDVVVPIAHGKALYKALQDRCKTPPFWAEKMGHNNIEVEKRAEFILRLSEFIECVSGRYCSAGPKYVHSNLRDANSSKIENDVCGHNKNEYVKSAPIDKNNAAEKFLRLHLKQNLFERSSFAPTEQRMDSVSFTTRSTEVSERTFCEYI